ncbi:MAG: YjjG family noncanonical pyrimidine nucleotidase [Clostridia bacterium]|nr:YjjG family noncanonical pyrimidine nucleotidase [Clostridia bacterium]
MQYTTLLFDADETLFDFRCSETMALRAVFRSHGLPETDEFLDAYRRISDTLWERYNRGEIEKAEITDTRFVRLFAQFGIPLDGVDFNRRYLDTLASCGCLLPGAAELCRDLRDAGYTLYIITNGVGDVQKRRFRESGLTPYVADIFISEEIGASKPNPAFFDRVLSRIAETDARHVLVIGDSLSADIAGGRAAGLDTCWYDFRQTNAPNDATYTVQSFQAMRALLLEGTK